MSELVDQLAIWMPTSIAVWVLVWLAARLFRAAGTGAAVSGRNLLTWPFALVLAVGTVFGLIAGGLQVALGEGPWSRVTASVVAALVSVGLVPRLWEYLFPPAARSSDLPTARR